MESIRSWRRAAREAGPRSPPRRANQTSRAALPQEMTEPARARRYSSSMSPPARQRKAFAGGVDDLSGAVVPGLELGAAELGIGLAQAVELGHRCHGHGIGQFNQGRAGRFQDGFAGRAQPELLERRVQEAERHRGQRRLGAAEVVEERAAGDPGGVGDVLHREVSGPRRTEQVHGGVGDGLPGGRLVQFAARGDVGPARMRRPVRRRASAGEADGGHALTLRACLHSGQDVQDRGAGPLRCRALRTSGRSTGPWRRARPGPAGWQRRRCRRRRFPSSSARSRTYRSAWR